MEFEFDFKKYIKFSLILNYIIFNTLAGCGGHKHENSNKKKSDKKCSNCEKKTDKNEQKRSSQEELEGKGYNEKEEQDDKENQKKLQNQKKLEEFNKKIRLENLKVNYKNKLTRIDNEIKILKMSIKEYFEKNNLEKTVTKEEINNITDPDNEKVGQKLEKLEKEGLKNLKINILKFLKTKFLNLKPKDKTNKLKIKEEDFNNLEQSEKIDYKKIADINMKLYNFEILIKSDKKTIIKKIKELYNNLNSKKNIVLEIINDKTLEEDEDSGDKKTEKKQFDLEKEDINNIDNENDIDKLIEIKEKLDNLKLDFEHRFINKKTNVESDYNLLKVKYNELAVIYNTLKLKFQYLNFDNYLVDYDNINKKIDDTKKEFIEKIDEIIKNNIEEINKEINDFNKEVEIDSEEIETENKNIESFEKNMHKYKEGIKEIINENKITLEDLEIKEIEKFKKILAVNSLKKDGLFNDSNGENNDEKLKKSIKNLEKITAEVNKIKNYIKEGRNELSKISSKITSIKDEKTKNLYIIINRLKDLLKCIFDINISKEDKNKFYNGEELDLEVIKEIFNNFTERYKLQKEKKYSKSGNYVLDYCVQDYFKKLECLNLKIQESEEKYSNYKDKIIEKNELGKGSFGKIYKIDENYVLKVINKNKKNLTLQDIKNEILFSYILKNENNIVKTYDFFEYDENIFIKMKFYEKQDLNEVYDEIGKDVKEKIYYQIITALSKFHEKNIAHCDLKVENIFIDNDNNAYIGDLGATKIYNKDKYYPLNLNTFSFPKFYIDKFYEGEKKYIMDLFKNDIFALGLIILGVEIESVSPDFTEDKYFDKRKKFLEKKNSVRDDNLKELLNIMLSEELDEGNDIKVILDSKYYKYLKSKFGSK